MAGTRAASADIQDAPGRGFSPDLHDVQGRVGAA
jgi:hypothetical protein